MADLRIVDAPEIPTNNITGGEKLPTGGSGNYSITLDSLADYTKTKKDLADNASVDNKVNGVRQELNDHIEDLLNPHQVTKGQIGLGNVDNTADLDKPVSNSTQSLIQTETSRAIAAELALNNSIITEVSRATVAEGFLQNQINANGVGNRAYLTYASMFADKATIPAKSKVTVTNDSTPANNGDYQYDGTNFTKSDYDPLAQANHYTDTEIEKVDVKIDDGLSRQQARTISNSNNIITVTDENGIPTWLAASADGGVPPTSLNAIQKAQLFTTNASNGLVFADENGVLYDLELNPDGSFSNRTKDALGGWSNLSSSDYYIDSDNVVKKLGAIRGKAAIFGSSTMELMQSGIVTMLQQSFAFQDIFQGGRSGERVEQIANRFGAIPVKLTFADNKINASGVTNVSVNFDGLTSMPTASSTLSVSGYVRVNNQDIRGTFSYSSANSTFRFSRTTSGTEIDAPAQYEFISDSTGYSDAALIILNVGKNNVGYGDGHGTAEYIADATLRMFKHIQPLAKKVIVASHFSNTTSSDALLKIVNDTNEYYRKQYSGLYFDMNAYLMSSQVWIDTAITPNSDDLQKQSEGRLPLSLSRDAGSHLSDTANTAVVAKLEQFILDKGWY